MQVNKSVCQMHNSMLTLLLHLCNLFKDAEIQIFILIWAHYNSTVNITQICDLQSFT